VEVLWTDSREKAGLLSKEVAKTESLSPDIFLLSVTHRSLTEQATSGHRDLGTSGLRKWGD
jgi:hypothetical protein